ncbi:MAG: CHAD domain-containing protein [Propionibacteriales bacterium]|nr:CHAD domain-containing protein [Propionibacteriales bacterium]
MTRDLTVDDHDVDVPLDAIVTTLSARAEPRQRTQRTWYDTFDWRLHRAGLLLEHQVRADHGWLALSELSGRRIVRVPTGETGETGETGTISVETLPEGAIRERVTALTGIRALLPRTSVEGPVTMLAALDREEKTVARVAVEGPLVVDGGGPLPVRLRVEALRGYDKEARRVVRKLAAVPGLRSAEEPLFGAACHARGLRPGEYRSKPEARFEPATSAGDALAVLLGELLEIMRENVDGTLRQLDTEFLHDLRVAVRRSRSAMKAAKGVFDEEERTAYAAELKWMGDVTTPGRDLDVYLLGFDQMVARATDPEALEPFRKLLTRNCRKAHTALNRALRSKRFARLADGWSSELARQDLPGPEAGTPIARFADARLSNSWRRVRKRGTAITETSPAEALHDLRKRCKDLRYLLEFFGSLYDETAHREVVRELKRLQDNLGAFQDAESQRYMVLQYAEELAATSAPARTLLAMGRLEAHLERRQEAARAEFADRWSRFDRGRNRRLFNSMVAAR